MSGLENGSAIGGLHRACIVRENTETDFSALLRAVRSDVVPNIVVLVVVVVVVPAAVVVVQLTRKLALVSIHFHFTALHVIFEIDVAVLKTATIAVVVIRVLVLHLVHVGFDVSFHVNEVVSVVRVATLGGSRRATVSGAHAESNKALGQDLDVIFAVSGVIPLLDVVASLELDTVSRDVAVVDIAPVHIVVVTTV